jgi:hypothetical protein
MTQKTRPELSALYERLARTEDGARSEAAQEAAREGLPHRPREPARPRG